MKAFFRDIFKYHHHYNQKLIVEVKKHLLALPNKTFPLLCHMINIHQIWNARILNQVPYRPEQINEIDALPHIDLQNLSLTLKIIDHEDLERSISYKDTTGLIYTYTIKDILFHVSNHYTHHKGQIVADFRNQGLTPLVTDYIYYKSNPL